MEVHKLEVWVENLENDSGEVVLDRVRAALQNKDIRAVVRWAHLDQIVVTNRRED